MVCLQEQASTFNLDAMQSQEDDNEADDVQQVAAATAATAPTHATQQQETKASAVTQLQMSSGDEDDFNFDSWGEDEIDITDNDESDETAEMMRQESQKLAQQIMVEEEERQRRKRDEEEEQRMKQLQQQQQELERIKREKMLQEEKERERLRKLEEEEEAQRQLDEQKRLEKLECERQAAKEEEEERLRKLREEEEERERERLRLEEEAKRLEEEKARVEAERLQRLQEEEEEAERLRLIEEEEKRRMKEEEKRLEAERLQRLEEEEGERLRSKEEENEEQPCLEKEAAAAAGREDSILDDEINEEIDGDGWSVNDDDNISVSTSGGPQTEIVKISEDSSNAVIDSPDNVKTGGNSDQSEQPDEVAQSDSDLVESTIPSIDAQSSLQGETSEEFNLAQESQEGNSTDDSHADTSFLSAAALDLASNTASLQSMIEDQASNLFNEASKSASMFAWGESATDEAAVTEAKKEQPTVDEGDGAIYDDDDDDDDDLDAMYDDNSDDSETADQVKDQTPTNMESNGDNANAIDTTNVKEARIQPNSAQHTVEDFVKQLERMSESHQLEMTEMQRSHQLEIQRLESALSSTRDKKDKDKARKEVASQDKFLAQMRELEKKFNANLKEKEDELEKVMQRNEGMRLKMDSMKREVDGLIKLVDERDDEIATLKQGHGKSMVHVEGKVKHGEEELARKGAKVSELEMNVSSLQAELDSTKEAYHTLKERAKAVATELKDRRVEVRALTSQNQELMSSKTLQDTQLSNLRAVVNQHELTIGYKDKDMEALNAKVKELEKQIEGKEKSIQDSSAVGEKAIASYKRKAQEALAAANSRLALANQAREEAESEAKAARSASDDAVKRARDAESKMAEAEKRSSSATNLLDELKQSSSDEIKELKGTIDSLQSTIDSLQVEADEDSNEREKLNVDIGQLRTTLVDVKKKESELREKLIEREALCTSLQKEVQDLTDEVQRNSAAAFKRANDEKSNPENGAERTSSLLSIDANGSSKTGDREEADGTIIMLQQELQGANDAIADLKLALRTALLEKADEASTNVPDGSDSLRGNDNTPLFYAIEKQNELNTARDEINRLANMLGDAEADKQEAYDTMEEMRQKMEQANARLLRYEKLGMKGARPHQNSSQSNYGPFRNTSQTTSGLSSDMNVLSSGSDSVVNLEYLKNVMLSYLKAKTLADRRKLVPVISTVLCLTPEEQAQAVSSVEENAGLSGVAVSFWENLGKSRSLLYPTSFSINTILLTNYYWVSCREQSPRLKIYVPIGILNSPS